MINKIFITFFIFLLNNYTYAKSLNESSLEFSLKTRKYITDSLHYISNNLDNFITSKKSSKQNKTSLTLELFSYKEEHKSLVNNYTAKLRIRLPNTQKKLRLIIVDQHDTQNNKKNTTDNLNNNESIALEYKLLNNIQNSLRANVGIRINRNLAPYVRLKYKFSFLLHETILSQFNQNFTYSSNDKLVSISSINFKKYLSYIYILNNYNEYKWEKEKDIDTVYNSLKLYQILGKKNYFAYEIGIENNDQKDKINDKKTLSLKEYQLILQYRYYIKNWMYYEVLTKRIYRKEVDFNPVHQIRFNFAIYFGK